MKNFDDFLKTLTEDEIASMVDIEVASHLEKYDSFDNQILAISYFISLGLIRRYHEWISESS